MYLHKFKDHHLVKIKSYPFTRTILMIKIYSFKNSCPFERERYLVYDYDLERTRVYL